MRAMPSPAPSGRAKPWLLVACCLAIGLAPGLAAQERPTADPLQQEYSRLLTSLQREPKATTPQRIQQLEAFLLRHDERPGNSAVLLARLQLGLCQLERFDGGAARTQFRIVRELAPRQEFDLRGRALYGIAQAAELLGESAEASKALTQLIAEMAGSHYAEVARVALNRLQHESAVAVGKPLPALLLGRDLAGRQVSMTPLQGRPLLLVFFAIDHEASVQRLEQLAQTWIDNGMGADSLVAFALQSDAVALKAFATRHGWQFRVLAGDDGFLQQDWMQLRITGTPSNWVVGRTGTLLLRDAAPERLTALLRTYR